jgi:membrane protein YqaA with SNARE-associated domain
MKKEIKSSIKNSTKPQIRRKKKSNFKKKMSEFWNGLIDKIVAILFFAFAGIMIWFGIQILYYFFDFNILEWIKSIPYLYTTFQYFFDEITARTDLGIFYLFMFSSLFFLPVPLEALYFAMLKSGLDLYGTFKLVVLGIIAGQIINYMLGRILGFVFISFINRSTRKSIKRKLSKYGILAVSAVHIVPFPFQIFNFVTGILRYSFFKWLIFVIIGLSFKHIVMYYIYFSLF